MSLGKGIPLINGFDLNSMLPLDSRTVANTMEEMNKLVTDGSVGDGQLCYCKADKKLYVLKDNVWSEVGGEGGGGSDGEILELNEADSNTVQFITPGEETTLTGTYDLNKTYKGFKITASGMERTFYFNAMDVVPAMNFKAYASMNFSIDSSEIIYITYEIGITDNNTISIVYKNESLPLAGGGSDVTVTFED